MKIGILTYHRPLNYGALLQALALRYKLESLGHEAFFYDYYPEYHRRTYALPDYSIRGWLHAPVANMINLRRIRAMRRRKAAFDAFHVQYLNPYCRNLDETADIALYGSDQIWRVQPALGTFNPIYFGKSNIPARKHVSYAASTDKIPSHESESVFKELLSHLDVISVRENNLKEAVNRLGYDASVVVDPTLLLSGKDWVDMLNIEKREKKERYVLYYCLVKPTFRVKDIKRFARERGCKLVVLHGLSVGFESKDNRSSCSPKEFLEYILNAEYVFTSSFHAMVFAINFKRPFYASVQYGEGRITSLLEELGISDRFFKIGAFPTGKEERIMFDDVEKRLGQLRQSSLQFLSNL